MKNIRIWIIPLLMMIFLAGCRLGTDEASPTLEGNQTLTQAYATINAELTMQPTQTPTETPTPTITETPTLALPTETPTQAVATTAAATAGAPVTTDACNIAGFVQDVTIPDGTEMEPGETFIKTWRLKNDGTCTWNTNYAIVAAGGDQMDGPDTQNLTGSVAPGETIDISLELTAPDEAGEAYSYWLLRSDAGVNFGIGAAGGTIYAQIEVTGDATDDEDATATPTATGEDDDEDETATPTATEEDDSTATSTPEATATSTPIVIVTEQNVPTATP